MNTATVDKKEEIREVAPGITRDSKRVYFDPKKTDIGKRVPYIEISEIEESWRRACDRLFSKKTK